MADKKIFTIQIDGIATAYKNIVKLKDAIEALDAVKLNIDDDEIVQAYNIVVKLRNTLIALDRMEINIGSNEVQDAYNRIVELCDALKRLNEIEFTFGKNLSSVINNIKQNFEELINTNSALSQSFQNLAGATSYYSAIATESNYNNTESVSSISALKEELANLKNEYEALNEAERNTEAGQNRLLLIGDTQLALAKATKAQQDYTANVKETIAISLEQTGSITQLGMALDRLTEQYNNLSEADRMGAEGTAKLQAIKEYQTAIAQATQAQQQYNQETQNQIAINSQATGSLNQKKILLQQLQDEYYNLSEAERVSTEGEGLAKKIRDLSKDLSDLQAQMMTEVETLTTFEQHIRMVEDSFHSTQGSLGSLHEIMSNTSEVLNLFGIESKNLTTIMTEIAKVTEVLNTLQALHSSLVAKDSIVMKAASAAQLLYSGVVQGSSMALKSFRIAMISTGVGAFIVLIGMLIANFDTVKESVNKVIENMGGLGNIMEQSKAVIAGVGNALKEYMLIPFRQIKNALEGLIAVFKGFVDDGFSGAWDAMKQTAKDAIDIQVNGMNVVANAKKGYDDKIAESDKKTAKKLIDSSNRVTNTVLANIIIKKKAYIKAQEEKQGADWKFTEEGQKAYKELFDAQLTLYKNDVEAFKKAQDEKARYMLELQNYLNGTSNTSKKQDEDKTDSKEDKCNCKESSGGNKKKDDKKKEQEEYEDYLKELKEQIDEYYDDAEEAEIAFQKKMAQMALDDKNLDAKKKVRTELKDVLDKQTADQQTAFEKQLADFDQKAKDELQTFKGNENELEKLTKETQKKRTAIVQEQVNKRADLAKKQEADVSIETQRQAVEQMQSMLEREMQMKDRYRQRELDSFDKNQQEVLAKYKEGSEQRNALEQEFAQARTQLIRKQNGEIRDLEQKQSEERQSIDTQYTKNYISHQLEKLESDDNLLKAQKTITEAKKEDMTERNSLGLIDVKATKENYNQLVEADTKYLDVLKSNHAQKKSLLEAQLKDAEDNADLQKSIKEQMTDTDLKYANAQIEVNERMKESLKSIKNGMKSFYQDLHDQIQEKWGMINTAMSEVTKAMSSIINSQLDEIKTKQEEVNKEYEATVAKRKEANDKLKSLEEEAKTASGGRAMVVQEQIARQMEANAELAAQEKDLAKQKEKLEKEKAKKDKQMKKIEMGQQLISGIANVALAVTKALATGPFIGQVLAGIAAAAGAVQTGIIASQMAKLEDGGLLRGKRHSQGGMRIEGTNIEVEGDEFVVNRISTSKNKGLIDYINKNRRELKAEDINSYFSRAGNNSAKQLVLPTKRMYEQGGMLTNLEVVDSINSPNNDRILEAISQINFQPVVSVVDISSAQDNLAQVKDIAGA